MKNENQNLSAFKKYLLRSIKERNRTPFSTEEVIQILKNYSPLDDLRELRDESICQMMKEEFSRSSAGIKIKRSFAYLKIILRLMKF